MAMSATSTGAEYSVPLSQNTAPVIEFTCLFTHDLRRKQKRWHDGLLRYHTFNRRIMVYDTLGSYIGDKHWKQQNGPEEGTELSLDKGALVEVGVQTTTTETDISELFKRRKPGPDATSMDTLRQTRPLTAVTHPAHAKHKSLNALLGVRQGAYGKASLPTKSPFQLRKEEQENRFADDERSSKRQRVSDDHHTPVKARLLHLNTHADRNKSAHKVAQKDLPLEAIPSSFDDIHSDVTVPPTPPSGLDTTQRVRHKPVPALVASVPLETQDQLALYPVDVHSRALPASGVSRAVVSAAEHAGGATTPEPSALVTDKKPTQTRPLRIVKAPPRRMLLCVAEQPVRKSQDYQQENKGRGPRPNPSPLQPQPWAVDGVPVKTKSKHKSLIDIDDELDAIEQGPSDIEIVETTASLQTRNRTPFQRATSLSMSKSVDDHVSDTAQHDKASRRLPFKKLKSMSTTDAGDGKAAKRSRLSKSSTSARDRPGDSDEQPLRSINVEPWSVEASDLFDWHPPGKGDAQQPAVVGM